MGGAAKKTYDLPRAVWVNGEGHRPKFYEGVKGKVQV